MVDCHTKKKNITRDEGVVINANLKNRTTYYSYINVELLLSNVIHCLTFSVKLSWNRWYCYHPLLRKGELTKIIEKYHRPLDQ